ncbi:Protein involved in sex pheromone biosynthesis [Evansella caseinilytica]|uniref:Protein involved in sex pheromone biosynthesis n=1 Tax=Evansella caseinilytica TaxID=1503961 RepID=A0A1H3G1V6_9BACI|nr:CamS family sex pheromone protein [Evansella caseinilytica]SDX97090.1 Protein involved in sex pheromone biosynthesis [Evansella caseinilytica]
MKRKISILFFSSALLLTGCIPSLQRTEEEIIIVEEGDEVEEQQYVITPTIDTPENYYRSVLKDGKYQRSAARGTVAHGMNNRIDIDQFELGLMEIATATFSQDDYYFREGEILTGDEINRWLRRYDSSDDNNKDGLNPELGKGDTLEEQMRKSPLVLSHIMEHNYIQGSEEDGVELGGIVIGLALRSVYYFRTEDDEGRYYNHEEELDLKEVEKQGKEIAQEVVERLRAKEELAGIPITVALFQEEKRGAIVPGTFIALTHLSGDETKIDSWEQVKEEYYFFPSRAAREAFPAQANAFSEFQNAVEEFFGRTVGIVGKGRYKNGNLEEMTIEFNLQSHGKAEIIALTQYVSGKLAPLTTDQAPTYVYINSINGPESIIVQYPDHEPSIHVYKN